VNTVILFVSAIPNQWTKRAAERGDLGTARRGVAVCLLFGLAFAAVRFKEFSALHVRWNDDAYGSVVWVLLGLHTMHVLTDVIDTGVLLLMLVRAPIEKPMFANISENCLYWYFVLGLWVPVYVLIYIVPRIS
jgi:cytochrome c oxidase subunit I+III